MKKKRGTRGAISVFLAIILVPCIVVSSIFVDLSRVHLSKASAESSADLALNALLTNYDADLKDWYGMVASCQNINEFYEVSANYFLRALASQGMSDEEIILLSDYYANATNDDTIYDLLKVKSETAAGSMISPVEGANLSNAALMKAQVVEFMKYRAPIEITEGVVKRFQSDSIKKSVGEASEAEDNKPLVDDKQEFYESEGKLLEEAYKSYLAIKAYYTAANNKLTNDTISGKYKKIEHYKAVYKEILKYVISNLSNTSGLQRYNRYTISLTYYNDFYSNPTRNFSEVYSEKKKVDGVDTYYIEVGKVKDLVDNLREKVTAFEDAKQAFENAARPIVNKPYGYGEKDAHPIQWWVRMNKAVNASSGTNYTKNVKTAAENMLIAYSKVLAIDGCKLRGNKPQGWHSLDDWKNKYNADSLINTVKHLQSTYLTAGVADDRDTYLKAVRNLESVSSANYGRINAANLYVTVDGKNLTLSGALAHISEQLGIIITEMDGYIALLDKAIDGEGDTPSLDKLKSYVKTYEDNLKAWTQTAENTDTSMGTSDTAEINKRKASIEITQKDVNTLKTRLVHIRSQLQTLKNDIESLKWNGSKIKGLTSFSTFKSNAGVDNSRIGLTNDDIEEYAKTLLGQKFSPMPTMKHKNDTSYDPQIDPKTGKVNTPQLWVHLYKKYRNAEGDMEKAKNDKESAESTGDDKAQKAKDKGRYHGGGKEVRHEYSANTSFNLGEAVWGIIGVAQKLMKTEFTGMRDDLYATTYVMEMFSYATYENEGRYHLLKNEQTKKLTLDNYNGYYDSKNVRDKWLSDNPKDSYNKSLTNKLINKTNNAAYCAEIEYILCGHKGSKNEDNVKAIYNNIYVIRYALNLVSGFQNFWALDPVSAKQKGTTALAIQTAAAAVNAATAGVIPVAVTEVVLIPILTIFETSKDLDRLEAGFPVELYKTDADQWWFSLDSQDGGGGVGAFMSALTSGKLQKTNTGNGLFYSDYLMLFVYLGFNSNNTQQGMYQRMAEVIQFNIGTMANSTTYSLKNSQLYFQLNAELRVQPLMITLPFFSMDEYRNELTTKTDWCTYTISTVRGYN